MFGVEALGDHFGLGEDVLGVGLVGGHVGDMMHVGMGRTRFMSTTPVTPPSRSSAATMGRGMPWSSGARNFRCRFQMMVVERERMLLTHLGANSGCASSALVSGIAKSVTTSAAKHRYALETVAGRSSTANSSRRSHS